MIDNIGLSPETFNYAFGDGATIGSADGEVLIAMNDKHHGPSAEYVKQLRSRLQRKFPDLTFFFQPADIVTQILNFDCLRRSTSRFRVTTLRITTLRAACAEGWRRFPAPWMSTCTRW
ncbi:MAG: hypothetical protein WDO73_28440 [Ignavibacteriota bacterium]